MNPIENLIDKYEDKVQQTPVLTSEDIESLADIVKEPKTLVEGLPALREKCQDYKERIDKSDNEIKVWQQTKKMWESRNKQLVQILGKMLEKFNVTSVKNVDGTKLGSSTRTVLEVDDEWLIQQYEALAQMLQNQLPEYIKVTLSVDKNKLAAYLKGDNSLLLKNPDKIHTRTSVSVTLK